MELLSFVDGVVDGVGAGNGDCGGSWWKYLSRSDSCRLCGQPRNLTGLARRVCDRRCQHPGVL